MKALALALALFVVGCANPLATPIAASNAAAMTLAATHAELVAQRKADQLDAAKAVEGKEAKLAAAQKVGVRYRPAWKAYSATRFGWLRLVAAIELAQEHPALLDPGSLLGLVRALVEAQSDLEAYARDAMRGVQALRADAPPPAPGVSP